MVSKSSLKKAIKEHVAWMQTHKRANIIEVTKQTAKTFKHGLGMNIRASTLPSLLAPMPRSIVHKLERRLRQK